MSPGHKREDSQSSYYFVSHVAGTSTATRDAGDEIAVIDELPAGSNAENFAPRVLDTTTSAAEQSVRSNVSLPTISTKKSHDSSAWYRKGDSAFAFLLSLFKGGSHSDGTTGRSIAAGSSSAVMEDSSGAKKVDPKVFFSAERTYLAWMHSSILLAGVSVAISAYSETGTASDIYGVMILPIAIVFMIYAMIQYGDRSLKIRKRSPGPYEDRWGPVVLGTIFVIAIIAEFLVKLFES